MKAMSRRCFGTSKKDKKDRKEKRDRRASHEPRCMETYCHEHCRSVAIDLVNFLIRYQYENR